MGTDTGDPEGNVFDLTAVGNRAELDDGVKGNVNPGQFIF